MFTVLQLLMLKDDAQDSKVLVPLSLQGLQILRQKAHTDNSSKERQLAQDILDSVGSYEIVQVHEPQW